MKKRAHSLHAAVAAFLLCTFAFTAGAGSMGESEVEAQVEYGPLRGTLLLPDGDARAALVIIPGSGPTDRDGNNPLGIRASYLRLLAETLAGHGIASIRIDKRGMFASVGSFADPNAVTFDDYAADALAWVDTAKREAEADCVWIVGHSEGGLVALVAAQQVDAPVCGLVLISAAGRRMGEVLREQFRSNPANAPILPDALAAIDALERGDKVDVSGFHPALQQVFWPGVQDFLIDGFSRDPTALIAALGLPVLIVQGDNDLQVGPEDAALMSQALPSAEVAILPGMNHVLKTAPAGDVAANLATYADADLPLAEGLAERIAAFVTQAR